jgi:hypothetical protein
MSDIFNYIEYNDIKHVDCYNNNEISLFKFNNVKFRTYKSNYLNFQVQLGIETDNKIISITNKQLSFLVHKYLHFLGHNYAVELKNNYEILKNEEQTNVIVIEDEVFQFFDYESVSSTGHSYDLMMYLLYHYTVNRLSSKLIVVETDNKYYNLTLKLLKDWFDVEYIFIKPNKTYLFKNFTCIRTYQNILFDYVKIFINKNLIEPIIKKYDQLNEIYYENIIKMKYVNPNNTNRLITSFEKTNLLTDFCKKNNIFDLNDIDGNEELKIYILNKANKIIIDWGSNYYININYYLQNTTDKFISLIFHTNIMPESSFITYTDGIISQNMPGGFCANYIHNNVYNNWRFKGDVYHNITNIDEYILRTNI